jgi:parallel beta-helix repeat protein
VTTVMLVSALVLALDVRPIKAIETLYIRADGSIDPMTANLTSVDNVTYTFTDDIHGWQICVERSNIVVDGAGHTLQGDYGSGIHGYEVNNVTVRGTTIRDFTNGIALFHSLNNTITGNTITANLEIGIFLAHSSGNSISENNLAGNGWELYGWGMYLSYCSNSSITGNTITDNTCGIYLGDSSNNRITGNTIANNSDGIALLRSLNNSIAGNTIADENFAIWLKGSSGNLFFHNNFIANTVQLNSSDSVNVWDAGYPSGGNYWSNHTDTDVFEGPGQNVTGSDGVWDHPYSIDPDSQDRYPLTEPRSGLAGDADGDSDVDIYDIVRIVGVYGVSLPSPLYDRLCDIDLDGDIDIYDVVIAADNYGKSW